MKKTYIIPATEVVEIKMSQLVMASKLDVLDGQLENASDFLSRRGHYFDFDDEVDDDFEDEDFEF